MGVCHKLARNGQHGGEQEHVRPHASVLQLCLSPNQGAAATSRLLPPTLTLYNLESPVRSERCERQRSRFERVGDSSSGLHAQKDCWCSRFEGAGTISARRYLAVAGVDALD